MLLLNEQARSTKYLTGDVEHKKGAYKAFAGGLLDAGCPKATIAYHASGGCGAPSGHTADIISGAASFTLSTSVPTRSGYTFKGWRLGNSSSYDIDSPGQYIQIYLDEACVLTCYAQWEAEESAGLQNFKQTKTYRNQFTDVSSSARYYETVRMAYNYGLMQGISQSRFGVSGNVTVAEILAAAFPSEALQAKNSIADGAIPDVPSGSRSAAAIYRLYCAGVLTGSDQYGTFRPNSTILRVEADILLAQYRQL